MIEAYRGPQFAEMALCKCDFCATETTVAARHGTTLPGKLPGGGHKISLENEGQAHVKLQSLGWSLVKKKLRCPKCEEKRKAENTKPKWLHDAEKTHSSDEVIMEKTSTITPMRKATPAQRREIHQHLLSFYDTKAGRYQDKATDQTIAEMIGGGCMSGWVAEIREADYGPDGGNAEFDAIRAEFEACKKDVDARLATLQRRIDAMKSAVGPRAAKV
jgi:hypothetical protein